MQQRAAGGGQLVLSSQPGEGTRVLVSVPGVSLWSEGEGVCKGASL